MVSFKLIPSSSLNGSNSFKYSSYCSLFSTLALIPITQSDHIRKVNDEHGTQKQNSQPKRTFKDPHSSRKIINSPRRSQCCSDHRRTRHKIIRKCIIQVALELEYVLHGIEFILVPALPLR